MSFSDSPAALGSMIDSLESAASEGTSSTPPEPANEPGSEQQAQPQNQQTEEPGTTEQRQEEGAATPPETPAQSPFPKELESFKPLFEKKKWDASKPDWQAEALRTLQEQEQFQGRLTTDLGLTRSQSAELSAALMGTPQGINEYRQRMGGTPLPFESTSLDDKIKAVDEEWNLWEQALSQDEQQSAQAIRAISQKLQERRDSLRAEKLVEAKMGPRHTPNIGADAKVNWARIQERDPEANKVMSALVPYIKSPAGTGILGSFGMDVQNIMSTPERANQAYELAQRLHRGSPEVFEAEVKKRVTAEMESQRKKQVQNPIPGGAPAAGAGNHKPNEVEAHLEGMFSGR